MAFDSSVPLTVKVPGPGGQKAVNLRFPTDDEWCEYQRKQRVLVKRLPGGERETLVPENDESALELLRLIEAPEQPELDGAEAAYALGKLSRAEVQDVESEDGGFVVILTVLGGVTTTHHLRMPSQTEIQKYNRKSGRIIESRRNIQEITVNFAAAGAFYDKLDPRSEGYVGAVPILHKVAAVNAVLEELRYADGEAGNF